MPLLKDGTQAEDQWVKVTDDDALPEGPAIVSLERWQEERDQLTGRNVAVGLLLRAGQSPELVKDDLDRFDVIALDFPKFADGRAFSYARLLRERLGFKGEIRAVGQVLRDQFRHMHRCGFTALEVRSDADADAWAKTIKTFSYAYQPAIEGPEQITELRHRRSAA